MLDFTAITEGIKNFLSFISTEALVAELERRGVTTARTTEAPEAPKGVAPTKGFGFEYCFKSKEDIKSYMAIQDDVLYFENKEELRNFAAQQWFVYDKDGYWFQTESDMRDFVLEGLEAEHWYVFEKETQLHEFVSQKWLVFESKDSLEEWVGENSDIGNVFGKDSAKEYCEDEFDVDDLFDEDDITQWVKENIPIEDLIDFK